MTKIRSRYDSYYAKHFARVRGWLPACKSLKRRRPRRPLKYFTLCAQEAIDIFMLERAGVIKRDGQGRLPGVYVCEEDHRAAQVIVALIKPPVREAVFIGPLERMLTFRDDADTVGRSPDEDDRRKHVREKLRMKGLARRLEACFPFDIVNFDADGNMLNPDDASNRLLLQAFSRVFELQQKTDRFLLIVTTPVSHISESLESKFRRSIESNVSTYEQIRVALTEAAGTSDCQGLDRDRWITLGFAKALVIPTASAHRWQTSHKGIYIYENDAGRKMLSSVVECSKSATQDEQAYVADIENVTRSMPVLCTYAESLGDRKLAADLDAVIKYRERVRTGYRLK